ncbi:MAG: HAD-IIA family hydrolase [Trueperaceae bacterium]
MIRADENEVAVPAWCQRIETLFLDLDGCVWFGDRLAEGAREAVALLRERGKQVVFITNVSSATRHGIAGKLTELGIPASPDDVQVPLELLPRHEFLKDSEARVFPLCAARVRAAIEEFGIPVTDEPARADVVVVGRDTEMTYDDLAAATQALYRGARLLALNMDSRVPMEDGVIVPGTGAIVAALREATGVQVELIGKPSRFFFDTALDTFGARRASTVMVGDTLDSDIVGGQVAGLKTVLVGGSRYTTLSEPPTPDLELARIASLPRYFR